MSRSAAGICLFAEFGAQGGPENIKTRAATHPDDDGFPFAALLAQVRFTGKDVILFRKAFVAELVPAVQTKFGHNFTSFYNCNANASR